MTSSSTTARVPAAPTNGIRKLVAAAGLVAVIAIGLVAVVNQGTTMTGTDARFAQSTFSEAFRLGRVATAPQQSAP